jgi:hypothetical protein
MPGLVTSMRALRRAFRALAAAALLALPAFEAAAQAGAGALLPERRVVVSPDVDFYGGDLRSIFATTLPICRDACLAETECRGFTFNLGASACFLKSAIGERRPFGGALSAEAVSYTHLTLPTKA